MSDESRRFKLGLFVLAGLVLSALGVVGLSAGRIFQKTEPLYCYFQESVQGLERGSPVKFRGVEVGRVEEINVMPDARIASRTHANDASLIEVLSSLAVDKISDQATSLVDHDQIRTSIAREVGKGLRVRIAWKDITGQKYLDLDYVDPAKSPRPTLPFAPPGVYIPTAVERSFSDIQRDVATVTSRLAEVDYQGIVGDVRALATSLKKRADSLDTERIGAAADAVRDLAKSPKIDDALTHLDTALARIESAAARLDDLLARPSVPAAFDDLAATASSLRRLTGELETTIPTLTTSLEDTLAAVRRATEESKLPETTAAARAAMADVGNTARQIGALRESARHTLTGLSNATRGLSELLKYLEENPDALLRGRTEAVR